MLSWVETSVKFVRKCLTTTANEVKNGLDSADKGRVWLPPILALLVCIGLFVTALLKPKRQEQYPVEIHRNVAVWGEVPGESGVWMISSDEPEPKRLPYGRWNCCPGEVSLCRAYISPGYIAPIAKWEERDGCKSIAASGLGFFWQKPGHVGWVNLKGEDVLQ